MSLITAREGGLFTLRLNRPDKKNALTAEMYDALTAGLVEAGLDNAVRAVLIEAEGTDFCAGNDIMDFARSLPALREGEAIEHLPVFRFLKALTYLEKPLIAAVQGQAVGVGTTLLLHCDLVVLADDARLSLPFLKLGLVPEAGSTLLLPQRIGHARAFEWIAHGKALEAVEAQALGLANRVVPAGELAAAARALALPFESLPANAVKQTKALMRDENHIWDVIRREGEIFRQCLLSPEAMAAFSAFLSRPK